MIDPSEPGASMLEIPADRVGFFMRHKPQNVRVHRNVTFLPGSGGSFLLRVSGPDVPKSKTIDCVVTEMEDGTFDMMFVPKK